MFIAHGFKPENQFWKYILGSLTIIVTMFFGQIPLILAVLAKSMSEQTPYPTNNSVLMSFLEPNLTLFLLLLSFAIALIGLVAVVRFYHRQTLREITTSRKKTDWNRIFFGFGLWAIFTALTTIVGYFMNPEDYAINFDPIPFAILFLIATIMIPLQTSFEEYLFRAYLMQGFAVLAKNKWFPLLSTSIIFGLMHIANPEVEKLGYSLMIYYIGTGLFFGIITLMDDGLELSLGFHAANNWVGALLLTSSWSAFQTHSILKDISEPTLGFEVFFPVLVVFPIVLFILSKKYGWTDWKERLTGKINIPQTSEEF